GRADVRARGGCARVVRGASGPVASRRGVRARVTDRGVEGPGGFRRRPLGARLDLHAAAARLARRAERREAGSRGGRVPRVPRVRCVRAGVRARARDPSLSAAALRDEVTDLLQRLVRVDTTNPPGNETAAAELLRDYLDASGIRCELIAKAPERANLVARIPGGDGPSLLLLSHTDVVLADPAEWSVPPFSGELRDGQVWGRGALDMKGQVAASAVAIASLAREGFRPGGDLIFAAVADEEVGDGFGLEWLCREHPDAVRCDYAINEGGGERLVLEDGRVIYQATVAEKLTAPFRLRVHGRSGHASMPRIADNALVNSTRLIERIAEYQPE